MKGLLCEEKKAFFTHQMNPIRMPNWPELKIKAIIDIVKEDKEIAMYFKDNYWELDKPHSKPFMMNVINNVYPGLLQGIITEANGNRNNIAGDKQ